MTNTKFYWSLVTVCTVYKYILIWSTDFMNYWNTAEILTWLSSILRWCLWSTTTTLSRVPSPDPCPPVHPLQMFMVGSGNFIQLTVELHGRRVQNLHQSTSTAQWRILHNQRLVSEEEELHSSNSDWNVFFMPHGHMRTTFCLPSLCFECKPPYLLL